MIHMPRLSVIIPPYWFLGIAEGFRPLATGQGYALTTCPFMKQSGSANQSIVKYFVLTITIY